MPSARPSRCARARPSPRAQIRPRTNRPSTRAHASEALQTRRYEARGTRHTTLATHAWQRTLGTLPWSSQTSCPFTPLPTCWGRRGGGGGREEGERSREDRRARPAIQRVALPLARSPAGRQAVCVCRGAVSCRLHTLTLTTIHTQHCHRQQKHAHWKPC